MLKLTATIALFLSGAAATALEPIEGLIQVENAEEMELEQDEDAQREGKDMEKMDLETDEEAEADRKEEMELETAEDVQLARRDVGESETAPHWENQELEVSAELEEGADALVEGVD